MAFRSKYKMVPLRFFRAGVLLGLTISAGWPQGLRSTTGDPTPGASIMAQLASVRMQDLSLEVQRQSVAKQIATTHRTAKRFGFAESARLEPALVIDCVPLARRESESLIAEAAQSQALSPDLLRAVIRQESAFKPCAISDKGAQGLMQLMPATAAAFNVSDPFDPHQNVLGGAAYLRQLMERYGGDASLALSAYNAGPKRVDLVEGIPDIPETQNYVSAIFKDLGWGLPSVAPAAANNVSFALPEMEPDVRIEEEVVEPTPSLPTVLDGSKATDPKPFDSRSFPPG